MFVVHGLRTHSDKTVLVGDQLDNHYTPSGHVAVLNFHLEPAAGPSHIVNVPAAASPIVSAPCNPSLDRVSGLMDGNVAGPTGLAYLSASSASLPLDHAHMAIEDMVVVVFQHLKGLARLSR